MGMWRSLAGSALALVLLGIFAPVSGQKRITPPDPDVLSFACQRMGALGVGISEASLKAVLGEPHRKLPQPNNATAHVYLLGRTDGTPYLAAIVKADRTVALQISGEAPVAAYSFNRVNLGDSTDKLMTQFGGPFHVGPSGLEKTELWTYEPWPFSFEVRQDRSISMEERSAPLHR